MSVDEETLATIMVFSKQYSEEVHAFIYSVNVNEVRLPKEYTGKPFFEMFALIEEQKQKNTEEIAAIDNRLATLSSIWYQELVVLKKHLEDIYAEVGAYANFGLSDYTFVIMGWIPKKHLRATRQSLHDTFGGRVVVRELGTTEEDMKHAPVWYDNPAWIKPFEFIMGLVALPKYNEFDPSPILAIFFPLFFGMMVGDIGYGLVILAIGLYVRHRVDANTFFGNMARVLIISSIPTIIFGYLFGEFFGNFGENMGWIEPVHLLGISWNRGEAIVPMLILAISIGVIHVFLGLTIGMRNAIITKSRKHLAEQSGMILAITAIIILLATLAGVLPAGAIYIGAGLMIIGLCAHHLRGRCIRRHGGDGHGGQHPLLCPADGDRHGVGDPRSRCKPAGRGVRDRNRRHHRRRPAPRPQYRACHVQPLHPLDPSPPRGVLLEVLRGRGGGVQAVCAGAQRGGEERVGGVGGEPPLQLFFILFRPLPAHYGGVTR